MAKSLIPDPMRRRHVIERDLAPDACLAIADAYLADSRAYEAVVFLVKAGATERIEQLASQAIDEGDAFLLKQLADAAHRDFGAARWLELAAAADRDGKHRYAEMARRHARSSED